MAEWISHNKLPTIVGLNQGNFLDILSTKVANPLVVIAALNVQDPNHERNLAILKETALEWRVRDQKFSQEANIDPDETRNTIFAHLDMVKWSNWLHKTHEMKKDLEPKILSAIAVSFLETFAEHSIHLVIDPVTSLTYRHANNGQMIPFTVNDITQALDDIHHGLLKPSKRAGIASQLLQEFTDGVSQIKVRSGIGLYIHRLIGPCNIGAIRWS